MVGRRNLPSLIDKVPNIRENPLTQLHSQQARIQGCFQISFKLLDDVSGQICLLMKHPQQRCAVG